MVLFLLYVSWNNNVGSRTRNSTVMRDLSHDPSRPQGLGCRGNRFGLGGKCNGHSDGYIAPPSIYPSRLRVLNCYLYCRINQPPSPWHPTPCYWSLLPYPLACVCLTVTGVCGKSLSTFMMKYLVLVILSDNVIN